MRYLILRLIDTNSNSINDALYIGTWEQCQQQARRWLEMDIIIKPY
jgi:hypothetical protein